MFFVKSKRIKKMIITTKQIRIILPNQKMSLSIGTGVISSFSGKAGMYGMSRKLNNL